jgi:hypothetical protein
MSRCPACYPFVTAPDRTYLQGVTVGIAMAEGHKHLGSYEAVMGNAQWCDRHKQMLAELIVLARKAMRGEVR